MSKQTITYHLVSYELTKYLNQDESILLNQILYWISKCGREIAGQEGKWIYNSLAEWHKQFSYWSMYKLRKTIKSLEDLGLIKSIKVNAKRWNHTKWYTINYSEYKKLLKKIDTKEHINKSSTLNKPNKISFINKNMTRQNSEIIFKNKKNGSTNRFVENQQIIITKNNYTNKSSYKEPYIHLNIKKKREEIKINSKEKEMLDKMLYIWNTVFEYSANPIKAYRNKNNEATLAKIYKTIFNNDLDKWREYACKVNSSQFLMGEKKTKNNFKAVFSWLIKEETIEKIQNGEYGVGDRELDMNNISKNIEEKKEDVVNKMDKKLSEYMKIKINDEKEREEFKEYVEKASITEDDSYGILKNIIKQVPKSYILEREEYKGIKENLYESYVMRKYLGSTKLDIRNKIREKTREIDEITNIKGKMKILREIEEKIKTKEIGDYSSGLLESILLSNSKKESRYLKGSSGESSIRDLVI
jgi:hypothetical protein